MDKLLQVKEHIRKLQSIRNKKKALEEELKSLTSEERYLEESVIPDLLNELELKELKFTDIIVTKSNVYRAYVSKANSEDAFKFLKDSNNDGILKRSIQVDINTNPDIIKILDEQGVVYNKQVECHYATLSKVIGELVAENKLSTDDFSTFGIYVQPKINIKEV